MVMGSAIPIKKCGKVERIGGTGAGNGIRTRDLQLGKLTLYH
jgi:hypothetical protein